MLRGQLPFVMKTIVRLRCLFAWLGLVGLLPLALSAAEITPPVVIQTDEVRFPPSLANSTITTGRVQVLIGVTAEGALSDLLVVAYDHGAFVPEVEAALRQWRFEPGKIDGQPASMRVSLQFEIGARKRVVTLDANATFAALTREPGLNQGVNLLAKASALDRGIAAERTVTPVHPGKALGLAAGKVTLDFYVDQDGHARLPVVRAATHPVFATAAIRALDGWKFSPPRSKGRPAIVHLQQDFVFANEE